MSLQRRSQMKRTPLASRSAALPRHAAPRRGGELGRRTRLRPRSDKTAAVYRRQRVPLVQEILAGRPFCEIRWDASCRGVSEGVHEVLSRGRGGSITDKANCIAACHYCNGAVSDNPAEAEGRGWLSKAGRPSKAVPRRLGGEQ